MNRAQARAQIKTLLDALAVYDVVRQGAIQTLKDASGNTGRSKAAAIISLGSQFERLDRGNRNHDRALHRFRITNYVRCDEAAESAAEDTLDALYESATATLDTGGYFVEESDAASGGFTLRVIDGIVYRTEAITVTYEEFY